jgi:DUF4097 and DUF4098 domain-containing protein YvlB
MTRFSALALVLLAASTAHAAEKKFDKTFTVAPGGSLVVEADGASVRVTGGDTNQVTVHMRLKGGDKEVNGTTLDATQNGNDVTATMKRQNSNGSWFNWGSWTSESTIEVTVPKRYEISVRTGGGEISLQDTVGSVKLNTSGGDITARNLNGTVALRTSGGQIRAESVRGDVDANTSGGDVKLLSIDGKIKGRTSGGSVRVSLVGANRGIEASTSGGDIELLLPAGTTGNVEASTGGGDIQTDIPVTTTVLKDTRLEGTLNGGGQPIEARTSGGSIRLRASS